MLLKVLVAQAACELAAAVISNLPDNLQLDVEVANAETKAENLMAFRVAHIFYDGLCRALDPNSSQAWETPAWVTQDAATGGAGQLSQLLQTALAGLASGGAVPKIVGDLLSVIKPSAIKTPGGNIPSPAEALGAAK